MAAETTLIVCAGIPRSGSTWLYNAMRLLQAAPPRAESDVYGAWIAQYDASSPAKVHVVKVHEPDEALAWRARLILTSRRDLRDIAASAWKRSWVTDEQSTLVFLDSVVRQHAFWKQRCAFEMIYECMKADPPAELRRLAEALSIHLDSAGAARVLGAIDALGHDDASEREFDPANLLHRRHIMDGRVGYHAETLPADILATINHRYAGWLRDNAYAA